MRDREEIVDEARRAALAFASWERLKEESPGAYAAFCVYRDLGAERNVQRVVETVNNGDDLWGQIYKVYLTWASAFRWRERAADYDRYGG